MSGDSDATSSARPESGDTVTDSYARGTVLFMGVELLAAPGALVPRLETELLGEAAAAVLLERTERLGPQTMIDMCTGAGNLACAIAARVPSLRVLASDLTDGCVAVARRNVERLGLGDRVKIFQGDLFAPLRSLDPALEGAVDVVVCNPPYISTTRLEKERAELLLAEPREAFDGGPYGISIHQRVTRDALDFVKPEGLLFFEIGAGQGRQVTLLFQRARVWSEPASVKDASGEIRCLYATRKPV
jgi:release factor glutamine methyltransferase